MVTPREAEQQTIPYSQRDAVMAAISLSFLVYGCEGRSQDTLRGTVRDLIDSTPQMGVFRENFGLRRESHSDPATAPFSTAEFVKRETGSWRFLTSQQDKVSGFYGAAFADDEQRCVWAAFSGTVTANDVAACAKMVLNPKATPQETQARLFAERVLQTEELRDRGYRLLFTGHSLGGALAAEVAIRLNQRAITINGAASGAAQKMLHLLKKEGIARSAKDPIIANYLASPNNGKVRFMDGIQHLMFLRRSDAVETHLYACNEYADDAHAVFAFIEFPEGDFANPQLPAKEIKR